MEIKGCMKPCKPDEAQNLPVTDVTFRGLPSKSKRMGLSHWKTASGGKGLERNARGSSQTTLLGCLEPLNNDPLVTMTWNQKSSRVSAATPLRPKERKDKLRFNVTERCRLKEFRNYNAECVLENFKLPLIFRKPVYEGHTTREVRHKEPLSLPPIPNGAQDRVHHNLSQQVRPLCRDSLDRKWKVASIPPVERRLEKKRANSLPKLEAKGTRVPTQSKKARKSVAASLPTIDT
ncbi:uncharacterized protein [Diadema setosum]|uniref:uncharacterized protein n=1 Tax=Diadema setosum TaxID=31175 RepID=UPI003B3B20F6